MTRHSYCLLLLGRVYVKSIKHDQKIYHKVYKMVFEVLQKMGPFPLVLGEVLVKR